MFDEREPAEPELTPDLQAIEGQLARLTPVAVRVDRDRLMFEAGKVAARPRWPGYIAEPSWLGERVWPAAAMLMTAASLLLAVSLVWQRHSFELALQELHRPAIAPQIASEQRPAASPPPAAPDISTANWIALRQPTTGYLGVRFTALTRGVDAIDSNHLDGGTRGSERELERSQRDIMNDFFLSSKRDSHPRS